MGRPLSDVGQKPLDSRDVTSVGRLDAAVRWLRHAAWGKDRRGWGTAALLIVLGAHAFRHLTWMGKDGHTYSDGYYSWLFARSLAFDFDIDLTNDYALCGDPFRLGVDEACGGRSAIVRAGRWAARMLSTSSAMSSRRSRSGGTRACTTAIRK